jgi:hypothetical protein
MEKAKVSSLRLRTIVELGCSEMGLLLFLNGLLVKDEDLLFVVAAPLETEVGVWLS